MELPQEKPVTLTAVNSDDTVRRLAFVRVFFMFIAAVLLI